MKTNTDTFPVESEEIEHQNAFVNKLIRTMSKLSISFSFTIIPKDEDLKCSTIQQYISDAKKEFPDKRFRCKIKYDKKEEPISVRVYRKT